MKKIRGGCLCGLIKYEITGKPFRVANCHCDDCRKVTGSAFATNIFFKQEEVNIKCGELKVFEHQSDSGSLMTKRFCHNCGSQIFAENSKRPGVISVKVGSIDNADFVKPDVNLYTANSLNFIKIDDSIENFEKMAPIK
jgi:hypothetical protein